jgi:tetratricopeptide (TPR) repeat protein
VALCGACRARLATRSLPCWVRASAGVLVIPFVFALARFPSALAAGIAFERGERAEAAGAFGLAVDEYTKVAQQFPSSTLALARKGIAAFRAGQYQVAAEAFDSISGREASADIVREVNGALDQMKKLPR